MLQRLKPIFHKSRRKAASFWLNTVHARTMQIAVTGSYGKTSTTHAIYNLIAGHITTLMTDLNLDTIYNVPITALKLRQHTIALFELGIDKPNEMSFHLEIVRPDIAIVTGITPVHSDENHLGSLEAIITEKRKLIEALTPPGIALLNYDDPNVRAMAPYTKGQVYWYGIAKECHYRAEDIEITSKGGTFTAVTPNGTFPVSTQLLGKHSCINLMAAIAIAQIQGMSQTDIQTACAAIPPLQGRLNIEPGPLGTVLVNDALRANPATTRAGLAFLGELTGLDAGAKKIAVLGEMGELGDSAQSEHQNIGTAAADAKPDLLICVGKLTEFTAQAAIAGGLPEGSVFSVPNVHGAAEVLKDQARPEDIVYLKGSLMRHLERILLILEGQMVGCEVISCKFYHQCGDCPYLEIGYKAAV